MSGMLIPVVGPSGAGKDTLIDAAKEAREDIYFPPRVITRPESSVGEEFRGVDTTFFRAMIEKEYFAFHWQAHGLYYGISNDIISRLEAGQDVMFNGSRGIIKEARQSFSNIRVIVITAPESVLAKRLAARGREDEDDIANRLKRAAYLPPVGDDVRVIQNDVPLAQSCAKFLAALPAKRLVDSV